MNRFLRSLIPLAVALASAAVTVTSAHAHGEPPGTDFNLAKALAEARRATAPFTDLNAAIAANYAKFPDQSGDCVAQAGQGGMGVHYLNSALVDGQLDPLHPELLVYRQGENGRMELAALEYVVPAPLWDSMNAQPPSLFGHTFHLLRVPNRYGLTTPLYTLHVWLWLPNPHGLFNDWNPRVHCD